MSTAKKHTLVDKQNTVTPIGVTNYRNKHQRFGIHDHDRLRHIYCIGKSGTGKSTLLLNMAISDIERGNGLCVIDPHGDVSETLLHRIPLGRIEDVIYFNPADLNHPIAFNPIRGVHPSHHHLVASGLISAFKRLWADSWGPRLEYILRFALLTLLEYRRGSLLDIQPLLTNKAFRDMVLSKCINPAILSFWRNEFDKYQPNFRAEATAPILNKIGIFNTSALLRNIVGQPQRGINIQDIMDTGKIIIANLSKGKIGEEASTLLGSMLITSIQQAALYRAKYPEHTRKPFYLYVDEMQSYVTLSFTDILSESRKYGLSLFLAHQFIDQLHEKIRAAVLGNVGTLISFRIGATDAELLAKEFEPVFNEFDLVNLPRYRMYIKLMIDGTASQPFSASTLPLGVNTVSSKYEVIQHSRRFYGCKKINTSENASEIIQSSESEQMALPY